eukprot:scaffold41411_cov214-Amphora_coffeaeformis.AAC.1
MSHTTTTNTAKAEMSQQQQHHHQDQEQQSDTISGRAGTQTVPTKMIGLWERRYIRFLRTNNNNRTNDASLPQYGDRESHVRVMWLQTPSGFGDMRIPKSRFCPIHEACTTCSSLADLDVTKLLQLAEAECFCGTCLLEDKSSNEVHEGRYKAKWVDGGTGFSQQVVSVWPEDGWLEWPAETADDDDDDEKDERTCMMEYAPEGQYIEDWRLQPGSLGMCCHLTTTTTDNDAGCVVRNIYIAGEHLTLAVDRPVGTLDEADQRPL